MNDKGTVLLSPKSFLKYNTKGTYQILESAFRLFLLMIGYKDSFLDPPNNRLIGNSMGLILLFKQPKLHLQLLVVSNNWRCSSFLAIILQTINTCNIYYLTLLPSLHIKNDHKAVRNV